MRIFKDQEFSGSDFDDRDSGALFCDLEFHRCRFRNCTLSITRDPRLRTTVRNVRLFDCSASGLPSVNCAIVEDVLVDGFATSGLFQTWGAVFKRVVLRGRIGDLKTSSLVDIYDRESAIQKAFDHANSEYYSSVDWAIDITEAEFKGVPDFRGVPGILFRRDTETQVVVTREKALEGKWKEVELRETLWRTAIGMFLDTNESSTVLVAPKRHRKFPSYVADLEALREFGIAEVD